MSETTIKNHAAFIWSVADLLRGDYKFHSLDSTDICRVHVRARGFPVDAEITVVDKNNQHSKKTAFFVRVGNSTKELNEDEKTKYVISRWSSRTD